MAVLFLLTVNPCTRRLHHDYCLWYFVAYASQLRWALHSPTFVCCGGEIRSPLNFAVAKFFLNPGILILSAGKISKFLSNPNESEAVHFLLLANREKNKTSPKRGHFIFLCCGGGIRTHDLQVMSLTSCRCSTPRY